MRRRDFIRAASSAAAASVLGARAAWSRTLADVRQARSELSPANARFWDLVRSQFHLLPATAYLNTAGLGASPYAVTNVVKAMMDREEEAPAPGHSEDDWTRIRGACAAFLGKACSADEIALVSTATEGINIILNGLPWRAGDEVITSTHEHVALCIPLLHKMKTAGIVVRTFEPDAVQASGNVDRIAALVNARTRLIFISHITCTTGQRFPVSEIGRLAVARNLLFALDGAQSLGHLPLDVAGCGAHFYTASCHKWLLGPKRTGILYVRRDALDRLTPSVVGAYSDTVNSLADRRLELRPNAQRFEYGTQNDALVYGLGASADFINTIGLEVAWTHDQALAEACYAGLHTTPNVELLSPFERQSRSAMVTFRLKNRDNRQVASALTAAKLRVRSVTEAGLDAVRASFHVYNNAAEVDRLLGEVRKMASS